MNYLGLGLSILTPLGLGIASGLTNQSSIKNWYSKLNKPWFTPPNWIFPIAWTLLYTSMGVCSFIVAEKVGIDSDAMAWYSIQLALNLSWSPIFFGSRQPGWALVIISSLWAAIARTTLLFYQVSPIAGYGMLPYWAWVSYAVALNAAIWYKNPKSKKE